jgi:hypothetical protein
MENIGSGDRGLCGECRHANQQTEDATEGLWACPWLGATNFASPCRIQYHDTGNYVFELYDGTNGTWGTAPSFYRTVPLGYEDRVVVPAADEP